MITSTAQLTGPDLGTAACASIIRRLNVDGIEVIAFNISYHQTMGYAKRIWSFVRFLFFASLITVRLKDIDVVYATSTPLTIGIPALFLKWFRGIPFAFEVRDQWPQIPIEMGLIKSKLLIKLLLRLEKTIYKNAAAIVALSPGMAEGIQRVLDKSCKKIITVIPNSCDVDVFSPNIDGSLVRKERGWGNKFVLLHTGAMGKANGLSFIIEVAQKLQDRPDILFVLIGEGGEKPSIERLIAEMRLTNIELAGTVTKHQLPTYLAACDIAMVIFANYPILEHNSANKFFDALSAGKPVLLNYSGWQRKLIEHEKAGWGCKLCDIDEFVDKVIKLNAEKERLNLMGQNARKIAESKFNRDKLARQALSVLLAIKKT